LNINIIYKLIKKPEIFPGDAIDLFAQCDKQWGLSPVVVGHQHEPKERREKWFDVAIEQRNIRSLK
jgi:hypothetical protein